MLVKLLPDQVARYWKDIKPTIEEALPPISSYENEDRSYRILDKLLSGDMHCWVNYDEGMTKISSVFTTTFTGDSILGVRNLLIYSWWGVDISKKEFGKGFLTILKFARANNCSRIVGYSKTESINKMVERIGGDTSYKFISVPVEEKL